MAVVVKLYANFREAAGADIVEVEGASDVASLVEKLVEKCGKKLADELYHPGSKRLLETVHILVNGRVMGIIGGLTTPVKDGDVVAIFPPVSGGALQVKYSIAQVGLMKIVQILPEVAPLKIMQGGPAPAPPPQPAPRPAPPSGKPAQPAQAQMKPRRRYWDIVIIIVVVAAIAAWQLMPKTTTVIIPEGSPGLTGYVFADAAANYRVAGAVVEVVADNKTYSTTVGRYGEYTLEGLTSGNWVARVKVAGQIKATENITISGMTPKEWTNIAPELVPNGSIDGVSVFYGPHGWSPGGAYK
ncbi:MAG: ubiquitin-like small modifier protein 1 [Candidatus Hadarchaeota archaeon]